MYKRRGNSNNRRHTSYKGASKYDRRNATKSGGYSSGGKSYYRRKNRTRSRESIHYSKYISKASKTSKIPEYINENTFADFGLHGTLLQNIYERDYVNPTKIQDQAIPQILKGRDVIGIASTGSGKTGAFLIPLMNKALQNPKEKTLIICPTRELANQINNEFRKFAQHTKLRIVLVMGGASIRDQIRLLKFNPQFVVATPGRLIDIQNRNGIHLHLFTNIVLDEVDQMLDMGFVEDIKHIIQKLPERKQSLFFSATLSPREEEIANSLLVNPIKIESQKQSPLSTIDQDIVKVTSRSHKMEVLHELLKKKEFEKVIVFSGTKREADNITDELRQKGIRADALHGDKTQYKRSKVLAKFRNDMIDVLIATDVAARGIDIPDVTHVINYDEPATYNDYIHRIGRTGRVGKSGCALTFVWTRSR